MFLLTDDFLGQLQTSLYFGEAGCMADLWTYWSMEARDLPERIPSFKWGQTESKNVHARSGEWTGELPRLRPQRRQNCGECPWHADAGMRTFTYYLLSLFPEKLLKIFNLQNAILFLNTNFGFLLIMAFSWEAWRREGALR